MAFFLACLLSVVNFLRKCVHYKLTGFRGQSNMLVESFKMFLVEVPMETVLIMLIPLPFFLNQKSMNLIIDINESRTVYLDNEVLHLLALFKIFIPVRSLLSQSIYFSDRAFRIW